MQPIMTARAGGFMATVNPSANQYGLGVYLATTTPIRCHNFTVGIMDPTNALSASNWVARCSVVLGFYANDMSQYTINGALDGYNVKFDAPIVPQLTGQASGTISPNGIVHTFNFTCETALESDRGEGLTFMLTSPFYAGTSAQYQLAQLFISFSSEPKMMKRKIRANQRPGSTEIHSPVEL